VRVRVRVRVRVDLATVDCDEEMRAIRRAPTSAPMLTSALGRGGVGGER
jgi:hypothetical protein